MHFLSSKGDNPTLEVCFDAQDTKTMISVQKGDENDIKIPLFRENDVISGSVKAAIGKGKSYKHLGIQIELICSIEPDFDKCKPSEMFKIKKELEPAGDMSEDRIYQFSFDKFEKPFESYYGTRLTLRYFLRASVLSQRFVPDIIHEKDVAIRLAASEPEKSSVVTMEAGIEECLYIEYSYNSNNYHLKDCIVGQIYFPLVRIKIFSVELNIVRAECYRPGPKQESDYKIIARTILTNTCPRKGDTIPFRCYLGAFDLTPSFKNEMASVKYYLHMVLVDDEDRRYPQRAEIVLWRKV